MDDVDVLNLGQNIHFRAQSFDLRHVQPLAVRHFDRGGQRLGAFLGVQHPPKDHCSPPSANLLVKLKVFEIKYLN
jgi:hypothetical protein